MHTVKVDVKRRVRLPILTPGDYYQVEVRDTERGPEVSLYHVPPPKKKWSREEVLKAIDRSPRPFTRSWDEIKKETRDID